MQKFSYHCHTNSFDIFDGRSTTKEMIENAVKIGFTEIGISNHVCCNALCSNYHPMFFQDFNKAFSMYSKVSDEIRREAENHNIKVLVGFEVDFFASAEWRRNFEKHVKNLDYDYLIGTTHFLSNNTETVICNMYEQQRKPIDMNQDLLNEYLKGYWIRSIEAVKSGYFNFIAHLDNCKIFNHCMGDEWNDYKSRLVEALKESKTPYELNTSGWERASEQYPSDWMIKELNTAGVPILISDDAHQTSEQGQHFDKAEALLAKLDYKNRFKF